MPAVASRSASASRPERGGNNGGGEGGGGTQTHFFYFYTGCPLSTRGADHRAAGVLSKTARVARREVEAAALEPRERARAALLLLLLLVVGVGARRLVELNRTATDEYSVVSSVRVEW